MVSKSLVRDLASGELHDLIADIAEDASRLILPYWRSNVEVRTKADESPVTLADQEAEALILDRLLSRWPGVQTVAEEAAARNGLPSSAEAWFWLIDPLDGTRGFISGKDTFTVNIALIHEGWPVAGVVSAPATSTSWRLGPEGAQRRGFGEAWRSVGVRERPSDGIAILSHSVTDIEAERLMKQHGCTRWQGADSSIKFCLIAEGRFDAYPRNNPTHEWDTAAGQAVLEAAGGRVLGPDGKRQAYGKPGFRNGAFTALGG